MGLSETSAFYQLCRPMGCCGLYPATVEYSGSADALEKLQVNEIIVTVNQKQSLPWDLDSCGFLDYCILGILPQEAFRREFNLDLVTTAPSVIYKVHKTNGENIDLTNPCSRGSFGD